MNLTITIKIKKPESSGDGNWLSFKDPIVFRHRITPILAFATLYLKYL